MTSAVLGFAVVAAALTVTPGLDSALVLRSALTRSRREAVATGAGILTGLFLWGASAAVGISALLTASEVAYTALRWAGAAYLAWFGVRLLLRTLRSSPAVEDPAGARGSVWRAARTGLATNLLNPKIGVFYVALLPQFLPAGSDPLLSGLLLAAVHAAITVVWFALLIGAAALFSRWLRRPGTVRAIDGVTGVTLVGFGMRLALSAR